MGQVFAWPTLIGGPAHGQPAPPGAPWIYRWLLVDEPRVPIALEDSTPPREAIYRKTALPIWGSRFDFLVAETSIEPVARVLIEKELAAVLTQHAAALQPEEGSTARVRAREAAVKLLWDKRSMLPERSEEIVEDVMDAVLPFLRGVGECDRWPDGSPVIVDESLEPGDFDEGGAA